MVCSKLCIRSTTYINNGCGAFRSSRRISVGIDIIMRTGDIYRVSNACSRCRYFNCYGLRECQTLCIRSEFYYTNRIGKSYYTRYRQFYWWLEYTFKRLSICSDSRPRIILYLYSTGIGVSHGNITWYTISSCLIKV